MAGKRNLNERAVAAGERAAALDLGYLLMQAGFTREEVLEVIRIKNEKAAIREMTARGSADERVIEKGFISWASVKARLRTLKDAGYHAQATDMGEEIVIVIDGGKKGVPLDRIPAR